MQLGLAAAVVAPYLRNAVGAHCARGLLLKAPAFSSVRAQAMGLVYAVVDDDALDQTVEQQGRYLLEGDASAQAETKRPLRHTTGHDQDLLHHSARLTASVRASNESRRRMTSFLNRRRSGDPA